MLIVKVSKRKTSNRYKISRKFLLFWTIFIGLGAVFGSSCMLIDPSGKLMGMDAMLPYFQVLPFASVLFQNFIFSGIALLIVNGITNILSFVLLLKNKKLGMYLGMIFGITLMLWIIIQFIIFPLNFMSTIYFIFGFLQFITGYIMIVGYKQDNFNFDINSYPNISQNSKSLVVYFSRMGYTKKIAYELANRLNSEIYEIKTKEKIDGNLGFWWCGRFGMHGWTMPIDEITIDLTKYEKVFICTPIWVFQTAAPVKEFCDKASGKIKNVSYCFNHFMKTSFKSLAKDLDNRLNTKHQNVLSYSCHFGKYKLIYDESNTNLKK